MKKIIFQNISNVVNIIILIFVIVISVFDDFFGIHTIGNKTFVNCICRYFVSNTNTTV